MTTRRHLLLTLRGVAICLSAGAAILLLTGWAAHRYRHNDSALLWLRLGALVTFLSTAYLALARPLWKRITDARLARLIEELRREDTLRRVAIREVDRGDLFELIPADRELVRALLPARERTVVDLRDGEIGQLRDSDRDA
jgi:hypothetical protein